MKSEKAEKFILFYPWEGDTETYVLYDPKTYELVDMMEDIHWSLGRPVEGQDLETIVISFTKALAHMLPHM